MINETICHRWDIGANEVLVQLSNIFGTDVRAASYKPVKLVTPHGSGIRFIKATWPNHSDNIRCFDVFKDKVLTHRVKIQEHQFFDLFVYKVVTPVEEFMTL